MFSAIVISCAVYYHLAQLIEMAPHNGTKGQHPYREDQPSTLKERPPPAAAGEAARSTAHIVADDADPYSPGS